MKTWYNEATLVLNSFVVAFCGLFATSSLYDKSFDTKLSNSTEEEKKKFYKAVSEQKEKGSKSPITVILNKEEVEIIVE